MVGGSANEVGFAKGGQVEAENVAVGTVEHCSCTQIGIGGSRVCGAWVPWCDDAQ